MTTLRNKYYLILLATIATLTMHSCELVVDVDLPEFEPSLVLNGVIHPDTTVFVNLTQNKHILNDNGNFYPISGATVSLYAGGTLVGTLSAVDENEYEGFQGTYTLDHYPAANVPYRIVAERAGFETVEATTTILPEKPNASIADISKRKNEYGEEMIRMKYALIDPAGANFYEVRLFAYASYWGTAYDEEKDSTYLVRQGPFLQEIYYTNMDVNLNEFEDQPHDNVFDDVLFNGQRKEFTIEFWEYTNFTYENDIDTTEYMLSVRSLSQDSYEYLVTSDLQNRVGSDGFSEPVQVFSNVKNGFGIWGSYQPASVRFRMVKGLWLQ